jgi:hypothetical protein
LSDSGIPQDQNGQKRLFGAMALVTPPWIAIALSSLLLPKDYYTPLFTTPEGQIMLGLCGFLSAVSFLLTFTSKSIPIWIVSFVLLVLPQMFVALLGPASITIIRAIGT